MNMTISRLAIKITTITAVSFICSNSVFACIFNDARHCLSHYTLDCSHWYAGANVGISHLRDRKNPNTRNLVNENGPGWNVNLGYQLNSLLGAELGYTKYRHSREHIHPNVDIARTEHYSVDVAATARYPIAYQFSALGKLGAAYNFARKVANGGGPNSSHDGHSVSPYWAIGLDYSVTCKIDLIAQVASAAGNHLTGSTDLWSVGVQFALV